MTDIDLDFADPAGALRDLTGYCHAAQQQATGRSRHPSGVYFQDIPRDPLDQLAAWDHHAAADRGFFKTDFLKNTIYDGIRNEAHLTQLLATEPPWHRLQEPAVVAKLSHLAGHFNIVERIEPRNILELAICIALIRPGKIYLVDRPRAEILRDIWTPVNKYFFKKSHAVAYAASIVVQLNHLIERNQLP